MSAGDKSNERWSREKGAVSARQPPGRHESRWQANRADRCGQLSVPPGVSLPTSSAFSSNRDATLMKFSTDEGDTEWTDETLLRFTKKPHHLLVHAEDDPATDDETHAARDGACPQPADALAPDRVAEAVPGAAVAMGIDGLHACLDDVEGHGAVCHA